LPVAPAERAIGCDPHRPGGAGFDQQRAVAIAAEHADSPLDIPSQHFAMRVAEAVTVADREDHGTGFHGSDEGRERRRPAALVWRKQDIGAKRTAVCNQQRPLRAAFDVRGQQQAQARGFDFEHAAAIVVFHAGIVVALRHRVQHLESDPVPVPSLPCLAAQRRTCRQAQRSDVGKGRHQPAHGDGLQNRCGAPGMVIVVMADDKAIDALDANCTQIRHNDTRAAVGTRAKRWSGVVEQCVVRRTQDYRNAVTHIEHRDAQSTMLERSRCHDEEGQQARPAQPAPRRTTWRKQQRNCASGQHDGPYWRRLLRPDRHRQFAQAEKREQAAGRDRMRELQNEVERHDRADEGGGHDDETDDRNGKRVRQRRYQ